MGLVVQTNMPSLNTNNKLSESKKKLQKSMEKLSSGCRINRSLDDASGLSISEKMKNQITVLDVEVDSCEDAVNMLQVAEGAMSEVSEMLMRCSELAGKATNGILGDEERKMIQDEVDQLHEEIDRINITTKYNGIRVFGGEYEESNGFKGGLPSWAKIDQNSKDTGTLGAIYNDGKTDHAAAIFKISGFKASDVKRSDGTGFSTTCCTCNNYYSIEFTDEETSSFETGMDAQNNPAYFYKIGLKGATSGEDVYNRIKALTKNGSLDGHFTHVNYDNGNLIFYDRRDYATYKPVPDSGRGLMTPGVYTGKKEKIFKEEFFDFQIGESSTQPDRLHVGKPNVSTEYLFLDDKYVLTPDQAFEARDAYKEASVFVSQQRGRLGAYQNRIEHTINNHTTTSENTTAAKSRIADTDMAKEYVEMTTQSVLNQAAISLLSQANTKPESVVSLLQG